ncbi:hypothetical protein FRC12_002739 [Ceratobasidium sp. 428]|nr:hypothetical protein FRC12_002739 [Ceratobasidium sp. 428]
MSNDPSIFGAAVLPYPRNAPEAELMSRLDGILRHNPHYARRNLEFRTDTVTDFREYPVLAAVERLIRWDNRHPDEIFSEGFRPHVTPTDQDGITQENADLGAFVDRNVPSIFVATARYYAHPDGGHGTRWIPRARANMFEYEIFAPGGIDVNLSLGRSNAFANQREVTFPGGIRPEFIRTARQYDRAGRVVAIWSSMMFDITASGTDARLDMLPDPVCRAPIIEHYWWQPSQDRPQRRLLAREQDPMREAGMPAKDDLMNAGCSVPNPPRAAFLNPYNPQEAYFFADTRYALIKVHPITAGEIVNGPKQIVREWPSLKTAQFAKIDAVLPTGDGYEAYFFAGDQYALINTSPGSTDDWVINGPKKIATEWPSLKKAGCETVDAVLPYPGISYQAYFFCGSKVTIIKYKPGTTDDEIVKPPTYTQIHWRKSLARFHRIDAAIPNPANKNEAYFFSGGSYMLINVEKDELIRGPRPVYLEWPALRKAGFYSKGLLKQCDVDGKQVLSCNFRADQCHR